MKSLPSDTRSSDDVDLSATLTSSLVPAAVGLTCVAAGAAAGYLISLGRASDPPSTQPVVESASLSLESEGVVSDLVIYPIKSCGGIRVPRATVTVRGLQDDRLYLVVDFTGRMLTQRIHPAMATISPIFDEAGRLVVRAPGQKSLTLSEVSGERRQVRVWNWDGEGLDCGERAGEFFSKVLGVSGLHLVRMAEDCQRPVGIDKKTTVSGTTGQFVSYADGFPFLVASEASLEAVRAKAKMPWLAMDRWRPNIVVRSKEGGRELVAWEENDWHVIEVGEARFEGAKKCVRCQVPRVDQCSGEVEKIEPSKTVLEENGNHFGQNCVALNVSENGDRSLRISVGDCVRMTKRKPVD